MQNQSNVAGQSRGRLLTAWPAGDAATAESPEDVDWEGGARLLAALHRIPCTGVFKGRAPIEAGWLRRLARSSKRLRATRDRPEKDTVLSAFSTLPSPGSREWRSRKPCLIHGDWHPGQVVCFQGVPNFIDIDDVGMGDPAWDLAKPAAWRLVGLLQDKEWDRFLFSYLEAGGPALDARDPWAALELPARAAAVQAAATALIHADEEGRALEDIEKDLVNACSRIVNLIT